jgi:hypothetical protein
MRSLLAVTILALTACKGDPEKCDRACRNYARLVFWDQANAEIAAAPPERREEIRREKAAKFTADLEHGIDFCVSRCVSANNGKDVDCWLDAKTAAQAKACTSD